MSLINCLYVPLILPKSIRESFRDGLVERKIGEIMLEDEPDDILVGFVMTQLEEAQSQEKVEPKKIMINLMGFLEKDTFKFMDQLWNKLDELKKEPAISPEKLEVKDDLK